MKKEVRSQEEFYANLKTMLEKEYQWPGEYVYKFIVNSGEDKYVEIENLFKDTGAVINSKLSAKGNFTSYTVHVRMDSAQDVIDKYKQAAKIEGNIML